jgi:hypothetical protein
LSIDCAKDAIRRLIEIDRSREPYAVLADRDRQWVRTSSAWRTRFAAAIEDWGKADWRHPGYSWTFQSRDAPLRLLMTDLAVRLYQDEQGRWPIELKELVPRYLPALPIDPFSGEPVRYRSMGEEFLVYSVGYDGKDDGGRFSSRSEANLQPGFDWGLDFSDE